MNLSGEIQKVIEGFAAQAPEETRQIFAEATRRLVESGIVDRVMTVGDLAPSFILPSASDQLISLDGLVQRGPVVLNFYRGGWCPYCNLELRAYQELLPEITELGARLVAISPELPDNSISVQEKLNLEFEVLSDVRNKTAREYGLVFPLAEEVRPIYQQFGIDLPKGNGDDSWELPIPATYVVRPDGTIALAYVDADYTKRLEPEEVIRVLRKLRT